MLPDALSGSSRRASARPHRADVARLRIEALCARGLAGAS